MSAEHQNGHDPHQDHHDHHHEHREVEVKVDGKAHEVRRGGWIVRDFKIKVHVPPDYDLDQIVDGKLTPLADDQEILIEGCEVFVSHVRQGGSS